VIERSSLVCEFGIFHTLKEKSEKKRKKMSMIRGLSQRMGLKKKDEAAANANTTTSGNTNSNTSGTSTNASGGSRIAGAGVSSVSPLELLLTQNNSNTNTNNTNNNNTTNTNNNLNTAPLSPRKNTARPPVPTSAPPSVTSSMRNLNADNSTATTTTTSVPFQQRLVYAVAPPVAASSSSPAPPAPRSNPPVKAASEELQIEFDEDDDDDDEQRSGGGGGGGSAKRSARPAMQRSKTRSSSADSSDDDSSGVDPDGPPPAAPLSPPEQEFDDDDDDSSDDNDSDAVLFADDREEFAEEPLPPVPSEPNPAVRSPPPPPSMANPQKQLVDELLDNDSHPLLAASAPSLSKFTSVRSSGESTTNPHQRERTLTRTTREKMLGPSSVSMRRSPPPMQQQQSLQSLHGSVSERTALFGGPGVGGPAAASFAAAAAAASRAGASPARAKDLTAPGLLKSVSEPASNRSAQQKTGWLVKKGKKRWFLLRGNVLYWFSKEVDPMADIGKGVNNYLQLAGCTVEATDSPRFSVRIAPPPGPKSKPYVLTAQDEATRARWMRSLVIAAAVRDESAVVTSGYMLKKGKRRFFVIEDDQLKWYLSSKMGKAEFKGCLQLATCRLSGAPLTDSVILESTSAAKSYELITSSPDEFKHWMNALETSIQHAQRSWRQRHGSSTLRAGGIASDVVVDGPPRSDAPLAFWTFQIEQTIPVTAADGGTFTTYMVDVTAPNGAQRSVLKRYRQFDDLDAALRRHGTDRALPSLPTKKLVGNMNPQFVRNRCLGLQRYLNQVAQLPGINELPEFIYFVTEHAAADGWHDSAPLQPADVLQRWAWIDEHRATPPPAPALVDATCVQGGLRIEFGCSERPPWLARAVDANAGAAATGGGGAGHGARWRRRRARRQCDGRGGD
jgi:hypothetical protein